VPAKKKPTAVTPAGLSMAKLLAVMTIAATSASLLFNFSTNSNFELLTDRFKGILQDPAQIGVLLALVYTAASLTQLLVGHLIDRVALKTLWIGIVAAQAAVLALSMAVDGWAFFVLQFLFMAAIFGAIPFTDAVIVRFVDDSMRSRVSGMRIAVSFGASSIAVWLIGPVVKQAGFTALLGLMVVTSIVTLLTLSQLPATPAPNRAA
jgi:MFS family permease